MTVKLSEADFMAQVTQLAELCGWQWVHFRTSMYGKHHMTAASGPLGKGWPDLFMVCPRNERTMLIELKRDGSKLTLDQERVIASLTGVGLDCRIWRPADWPQIEAQLR